jgi:Co/Zn/Cd efflux system component
MDHCCNDKASAIDRLSDRQTATLRVVLVLNAAMFVVELGAGLLAHSMALLADSLDMLGDALVYGFSLYVVRRGPIWKARAAVAKAGLMALFGLFVLGQLAYKVFHPQLPIADTMSAVGGLALAANAICFALLWRHRAEDINMRSVWVCSRNDLIANLSVILAAAGVWFTRSPWPDFLVGGLLCTLFLRSAAHVARDARTELRQTPSLPHATRPVPAPERNHS